MTALITFMLLLLGGMGLFIAGIFMMFGIPAALLAGAAACLFLALFLHIGMTKAAVDFGKVAADE